MPRSRLLLGIAMAALLLLVAWVWRPRPSVDLPRLGAADVAALTASDADNHRLLVHFTAVLLGTGDRLRPWRELPAETWPVWTTVCLEADLASPTGLAGCVQRAAAPSDLQPGFADAAAGYEALGCAEMAALMHAAASACAARQPLATAFPKTYRALLPAARSARIAYLQSHLQVLNP